MKKLPRTQEALLKAIARGETPQSFKGEELRAAGALINRGLIGRKAPSIGYTLTKAGEVYARDAGWLEAAPLAEPIPETKVPEASILDVLNYQLKEQRGRTLRAAELLLDEVTHLVTALRAGAIPTSAVNPNTVNFLVADLSKLTTLHDTLELVKKG